VAEVGSALKEPTLGGLSILENFLRGVCSKDTAAVRTKEPTKKVEFNGKTINRFYDDEGKVATADSLEVGNPYLNKAMALDVLVTGANEILLAHGGKIPVGHKQQLVISRPGEKALTLDLADLPSHVNEQTLKVIVDKEATRLSGINAAVREAEDYAYLARYSKNDIAKAGEKARKEAEAKDPMPLVVKAMDAIMRTPAEIKVNTNGTDAKLSFPKIASLRVQLVEA